MDGEKEEGEEGEKWEKRGTFQEAGEKLGGERNGRRVKKQKQTRITRKG